MTTYTRTHTDTAEVTVVGDVAVVHYLPGKATNFDAERTFLVDAAEVARADRARKDPVETLLKLDRYQILTEAAGAELTTRPYETLNSYGREWFVEDDPLEVLPVAAERLVRVDYSNHTFFPFRGELPISRAYLLSGVGFDGARLDLSVAAEILEAHPWVLGVEHDRGRPGSYDHVPPSLNVTVRLPQDIHDLVYLAASTEPRGYFSANRLVEIFTWYIPEPGKTPTAAPFLDELGYDPLGLAPARRAESEYHVPEDW